MTDVADPARSRLVTRGSTLRAEPRVAVPVAVASRAWTRYYRAALLAADVLAMTLATIVGHEVRFGTIQQSARYVVYAAVLVVGWLVAMQTSGGYDIRHLATGPAEARIILRGSALTVSIVAICCYATKTQVARGFVVVVIPAGVVLLFLGRALVRAFVDRRRRHGRWSHRILAVGTTESVRHLLEVTRRARGAGLDVVGVCVEDSAPGTTVAGVPVLGGVLEAARTAERTDADVVAVTGSGLGPSGVRQLGWQLEGTGRGLVIAPALTEVAGPRVRVSPVDGLPLMWLEQPRLGRIPRTVKRSVDIAGGLLFGLAALPLLVLAAVAIKLDSRGPVLYRQRRLGVHGEQFTLVKLRTMHVGADAARHQLLELNDQDGGGVLFKARRDPRVTRVGRVIRQFSVDELPQLLHVISGRMSLVGPRPLAAADSTYTGDARRRLLVRPGLTGLWQVSGRSDLSWNDAVRLDLYYVENWSLCGDLGILARTFVSVLSKRGAY